MSAVALSPDGRYAISSDEIGTLILWDATNGRELHRIGNCHWDRGNLAFSLDGKLALAAVWPLGYVQGWSLPHFQPVRTWKRKGNSPRTVAVSPLDGTPVTSGGSVLTFWDSPAVLY